ncbi:MAG: thioredoxin domain-containing protein, partial [Phycisphaerae bacterium]|nr:thioredoxin domain-containing protein [Phycisphaerae bacterium]
MPNRLAGQTSPYLLQHARNPVDWWPWGPEAFDEARRRDVPILLSIGYSTCYWCHVMERESFENEEVAAVINREAVPIKLDREERPDVDDLYMAATLIVRGQGGWPMNCFLEPATLKPFFCGTYFPAEARGEMPGFADIVSRVGHAWRTQRERVLGDARTIADAVREQTSADEPPVDLGPGQVSQGVETLLRMADRDRGGFGHAPKFPQPTLIEFLLDVRPRAGDADTAGAIDAVVRRTLDAMACGGVRDQAGGGFHRYAVDHAWLVPHFEKMLYDNAQLAAVYAHAATLYGDPEYARVARETVAYVRRELTEPGGAFCSAQDAEVDHREGLNYLWTPEQVRAAMPPDDAEWAIKVYGLDQGPNFQDPHHPHDSPANVLRLAARPERLAGDQRLTREAFVERLRRVNAALYEARLKRKQPLLDDKVIASWNGMMIAAMARVGQVLDDPDTVDAAERAADRVLALLTSPEGPRRVARAGVPGHAAALLEDHAALASGLAQV